MDSINQCYDLPRPPHFEVFTASSILFVSLGENQQFTVHNQIWPDIVTIYVKPFKTVTLYELYLMLRKECWST